MSQTTQSTPAESSQVITYGAAGAVTVCKAVGSEEADEILADLGLPVTYRLGSRETPLLGSVTRGLPNLAVLDQAAPLRGAGSGAPRAGLWPWEAPARRARAVHPERSDDLIGSRHRNSSADRRVS
jgi:hypothetical protein